MPPRRAFRRIRPWLLGSLFVVLFAVISLEFKKLQNTQDYPHLAANDNELSERDRAYVDRYTDLSKWLITLSYALLAGVATKSVKDKDDSLSRSMPFSIGIGLLVLSLYAGFLSYQSVLIVLSSKPLWMLRSRLTSFPVATQLWLLSAATAFLAFAFFRTSDGAVGVHSHEESKAPKSNTTPKAD
jgi:hypothetical protein